MFYFSFDYVNIIVMSLTLIKKKVLVKSKIIYPLSIKKPS